MQVTVSNSNRATVNKGKILINDRAIVLTVKIGESYDFFDTKNAWCFILGTVRSHKEINAKHLLTKYLTDQLFFNSLEGKFLAVIYKKDTREFTIFTDPLGLQKAYYYHSADTFILSSHIKDILDAYEPAIDELSLSLFFTFQYIPHPYTMFKNILQIPINSTITYVNNDVNIKKYTAPFFANISQRHAASPNEIRSLLEQSLAEQLPKYTSNVGAFLSGGMDTSTNVAILAERGDIKPIVFTAGFEAAEYDEVPYAKIVADKYKLEHHIFIIKESDMLHLDRLTKLYDNPVADRAILPEYIICKTAQDMGIKHMLSGEGGDEVLGYPRNISESHPFDEELNNNEAISDYYYRKSQLLSSELRDSLLLHPQNTNNYLTSLYESYPIDNAFEKIYFGQWQTWLTSNVFAKDIQLFTHYGLNFISPYISIKLMTYMAATLPNDKIIGLRNKLFVKNAFTNILPVETINKKKHKFHVPISEWFRGNSYSLLHDTLLASDSLSSRFMDTQVIQKLLNEHKSGIEDHNRPLWAMLFLEFWYKNIRS